MARTSYVNELDQTMIKMLYTYKFGKFTQWPDKIFNSTNQNFRYCILGQNQFSQTNLEIITGKLIRGVPVFVEIFNTGLAPKEVLSACQILFISISEKHRFGTVLMSLNKAPVLTVSDIPGFSTKGGMITLVKRQGNIRFQINPIVLQQAGLSISSKILELAEIIQSKTQ